jgi:16S rRNA (guanine527-N7)-methyltransferase
MVIASNSQIKSGLSRYGFNPSKSQCEAIRAYISLLLRWNEAISLTAVSDVDEILRFHFGESLFALQHVSFANGRLADVGSGAGFPGLALKIGRPLIELTLVEPNQKKATFLQEIARSLRLEGVKVLRTPFEQLTPEIGQFEQITARALGSHAKFVRFAESRLSTSGKLILWISEEDASSIKSTQVLQWGDPVLIPGSKRRFLLIGSKK